MTEKIQKISDELNSWIIDTEKKLRNRISTTSEDCEAHAKELEKLSKTAALSAFKFRQYARMKSTLEIKE